MQTVEVKHDTYSFSFANATRELSYSLLRGLPSL